MTVIDTSAVVAILRKEPDASAFAMALASSATGIMSAATYVELVNVLWSPVFQQDAIDRWLSGNAITIVPVDAALARRAADALVRFGRGRHPARLNYGDSFAYALATARDLPLLYNGEDFARTDVRSALG